MLKLQGALIVGAGVLVAGLYFLPKVVVKNPSGQILQTNSNPIPAEHNKSLSNSEKQLLAKFKKQLQSANNLQEKTQWHDSLAAIYKKYNHWDSVAFYSEQIAQQYNQKDTWLKTAESYFEAFSFTLDTARLRTLGEKSLKAYEKVLAFDPENLLVQTKMGVLYKTLNPQAPMKGIQMVASVVRKDPNNELALFYLGTFYAERGAFHEATARFEKVVNLNPQNVDAWLYLAQCYEETQRPQKAKQALQKVLSLQVPSEIKQAIEKKLKTL